MIRVKTRKTRVWQGDIFENVEYTEYTFVKGNDIEISKILFPFVYILSQDCDLEQDYNFRKSPQKPTQDKYLISILVAPIYNAEKVYTGEHLLDLNMKMTQIPKSATAGKNLRNNTNPRYHYLEFEKNILVPSVIDFKHYFTLNLKYLNSLKKTNYVCSVSELYREDISLRFANYLSRIGLPG